LTTVAEIAARCCGDGLLGIAVYSGAIIWLDTGFVSVRAVDKPRYTTQVN